MRAMERVESLRARLVGRLPTWDSRRERLLGWWGPLTFAVLGGIALIVVGVVEHKHNE